MFVSFIWPSPLLDSQRCLVFLVQTQTCGERGIPVDVVGALKPLIALNTSAFLGMVETHRSANFLKNCQANFCEHFTLNMNFSSFTLI